MFVLSSQNFELRDAVDQIMPQNQLACCSLVAIVWVYRKSQDFLIIVN